MVLKTQQTWYFSRGGVVSWSCIFIEFVALLSGMGDMELWSNERPDVYRGIAVIGGRWMSGGCHHLVLYLYYNR